VLYKLPDCACLLQRQGGTVKKLTKDHAASDGEEKARIESITTEDGDTGGVYVVDGVSRVNGVLAVARAFGNPDIADFVKPHPDVFYENNIQKGDNIFLYSDGMDLDLLRASIESLPKDNLLDFRHTDLLEQTSQKTQDNVTCMQIRIT
jgi:serine/threonine protein phosphatase PrpC